VNFYVATDKGEIGLMLTKADQDCWLVSVTGILESWILPNYDEELERNLVGPCERWEVVAWVATTAEARGARVLQIGEQ